MIKSAIGVDMFPHTHHKEMVLLFERTVDTEDTTTVVKIDDNAMSAAEQTVAIAIDNDIELDKLEGNQTEETMKELAPENVCDDME